MDASESDESGGSPDPVDVMAILLHVAEFGRYLNRRVSEAAPDEELVNNSSMITLGELLIHGPRQPRELAQLLELTSGGVTRLVQRLEDAGLVERERGAVPGDARIVQVSITPAGVDFVRQVAVLFGRRLDDIAEFAHQTLKLIELAQASPSVDDTRPDDDVG